MRLDEIGLQLNCLGVTRDRLFEAVQSLQEMTVIVVRFGEVRMGFQYLRVLGRRSFESPAVFHLVAEKNSQRRAPVHRAPEDSGM